MSAFVGESSLPLIVGKLGGQLSLVAIDIYTRKDCDRPAELDEAQR
jgi:hypothetical protein